MAPATHSESRLSRSPYLPPHYFSRPLFLLGKDSCGDSTEASPCLEAAMNFIRRTPRDWPYAANSTGRHRGSLKTRKGRMPVFEAKGPAREKFANDISAAIVKHLRDNSDKLQDSATYVGLSLFMMGKSADQTKPVVMLVSDDKQARMEAFCLIKDSGIMKEYPGFDLGEMELKAEFENLRPLGSGPDPVVHQTPRLFPDPSDEYSFGSFEFSTPSFSPPHFTEDLMPTARFNSETSRAVPLEPYLYDPQQSQNNCLSTLLPHSAPQREPASFAAPDHQIRLFSSRGVLTSPSGSCAWLGGVVKYDGQLLAHTVNHFLSPARQAKIRPQDAAETETSDVECEIMGLSDWEDDDDEMADVTSRASLTPNHSDREESESEGGSPLESERSSASNASIRSPVDSSVEDSPLLPGDHVDEEASAPQPWIIAGDVIATSEYLDSAFLRVDMMDLDDSLIIPLGSYEEHVETAPRDVTVRTMTRLGEVSGTLSGTPFFVRLPGTKDFQEVYTAKMDSALQPGDCGCWIKSPSGKLFGHVIAGSPTSGQVLVMPAARVFAQLLRHLSARATWGLGKNLAARSANPVDAYANEMPFGFGIPPSSSPFELEPAFSALPMAPWTKPSPTKEEIEVYPEEPLGSDDSDWIVDPPEWKRRKVNDVADWRPKKKAMSTIRPMAKRMSRPAPAMAVRRLPPPASESNQPSCPEHGCKQVFPDRAALDAHTKKKHTRPYVCVFHFAGCESTFASKNEWKRHVSSQHLLLQYWVCHEDECGRARPGADPASTDSKSKPARNPPPSGSTDLPKGVPNSGAIFNRKDLYTQHMQRMHMPWPLKKNLSARGKQPITSESAQSEWEAKLRSLQEEAIRVRCALPEHLTCPATDCTSEFHGPDAWDQRLEHVARHLDRAWGGYEPTVVFGGENDAAFVEWASRDDVGIIEKVDGEWSLKRGMGGRDRFGGIERRKVRDMRDMRGLSTSGDEVVISDAGGSSDEYASGSDAI
ncbi:hypothetical protein B0T14DRAFT_512945 [Immersiella caudata]|uniref:C2H2-type domain-containing protein n=1 Tax=Immersiella caudata TaxID=314043 RepID=A0AA39X5B6_9PEZI|nr:hypothetical protein B0T14DRAFT_512945 [Immersiella caudata]